MGNYTSCFSLRPRCPEPGALLLGVQGGVRRRVELPVTAAELMLEEPFHGLVPLDDLRRTRRILPMRADEGLAAGRAYVVVPLERVNGKVPQAEMEALEDAACNKGRRRKRCGGSRISPAVAVSATVGETVEEENRLDKVSGGRDGGLTSEQMVNCRKFWRPVLETISEIA